MNHILTDLHSELQRTHNLSDHYRDKSLKEKIYSLFGKSFKNLLHIYAHEKEDILMTFATLHYDIEKDVKNPSAPIEDTQHIQLSITSLTHKIECCSKTLERLISHSQRQEDIMHEEKKFFARLIESFQQDLVDWVNTHEKEIFGRITNIDTGAYKDPISASKSIMEKQKQKLNSHMNKISNK